MTKLYLSAIVKNEAHIIRRMLESAKPYISGYLICDTGSTDGTQDIIREVLSGLPGEVIDRPWVSFGHNKSEALEYGRQKFSSEWYALIFDADEELVVPKGFRFPKLELPLYNLNFKMGEFVWGRSALFSNAHDWRYDGVLHEAPVCPDLINPPQQIISGPVVNSYSDGNRSQQDIKVKYTKDAEVLEAAMAVDPDNARNQFYLAQSYRDSDQFDRAIDAYEKRAAMGGWPEEVYWSLLEKARTMLRSEKDMESIKKAYLRAWRYRKERIEAAVELASLHRMTGRSDLAVVICKQVLDSPLPEDILFVTASWWTWRRHDEYAVNCWIQGDIHEAIKYTSIALEAPDLNESDSERMLNNLAFWNQELYNTVTA